MPVLRILTLFTFLTMIIAHPARALTLLRDPDIEYALNQLAAPVLKAAGLSPARIDILVIDDRRLNAFVVDANNFKLIKVDQHVVQTGINLSRGKSILNGLHLIRIEST